MLSRSEGIVRRTFIRIFTEADLWETRTEHSLLCASNQAEKAKQQRVRRRDTVPAAAVFPRRSRRATRFTSRLSLDYSIFSRKIHEIIVKNPLSVKKRYDIPTIPLV